jgi:hypothetical protein
MPGSQYWMISFIIILILGWFLLRSIKSKYLIVLIYFLMVNVIMTWSLYNDQLAFEDAFAIGHINTTSAILLVHEIYLSYYLLIGFNCLFVLMFFFQKYFSKRKQTTSS